jgi:hypothetical protein
MCIDEEGKLHLFTHAENVIFRLESAAPEGVHDMFAESSSLNRHE